MSEPIEQYLDDLYAQLRTDPRRARRMLDEAADHLHGAADALRATGMDRVDAEREAVRRFGSSAIVARADRPRTFGRLLVDTAEAVVVLGAVGLVAVGVSGLLAGAMAALFGREFVGGGLVHSIAGGTASVAENAGDALVLRALAGALGVALLGAAWLAERAGMRLRVLPMTYVDTAGLVAFAGATVVLSALSLNQVLQQSGHGTGFFLSGALASLAGAIGFGIRAVRSVLDRPDASRGS
jgi:hypothetical protein